jgi:hypothetical protein
VSSVKRMEKMVRFMLSYYIVICIEKSCDSNIYVLCWVVLKLV